LRDWKGKDDGSSSKKKRKNHSSDDNEGAAKKTKNYSEAFPEDLEAIFPRILPNYQKKTVSLERVQHIAFKLNKLSQNEEILSLLNELNGCILTREMLKHSHIILVVKRLLRSPTQEISSLALTLFDEFTNVLQQEKAHSIETKAPRAISRDAENSSNDSREQSPENIENIVALAQIKTEIDA